jgi:site-specific recombinase XerD
MFPLPQNILAPFDEVLEKRAVPASSRSHYRKWLRYFLDFCRKYPPPAAKSEQVRSFIEKLRTKKQTPQQCTQAAHAISLFFEMRQPKKSPDSVPVATLPLPPTTAYARAHQLPNAREAKDPIATGVGFSSLTATAVAEPFSAPLPFRAAGGKRYNEWRCLEKSKSPAWDHAIEKLATEIKTRHYSRKTLKTYADWGRKFQRYLRDRPPEELSSDDVKAYLTYLAVQCRVASSTQNQAFNALLFLFRHVLKSDFGDQRDVPRAKKSRYIPVVLSRPEIDAITKHLEYPFDIVVKLLYGCGLRLFESLSLRVQNFNFEEGILTVHGKGDKDRTVPIPQAIRHPSLARELRYPHNSDIAGPCRCENDDDLYPLRAEQNREGGKKPAGFLTLEGLGI